MALKCLPTLTPALKPAEVLVKEGKPHLIRKRDTIEDLLKNQIELQ
jgi:diaminopimelate decarboxylase